MKPAQKRICIVTTTYNRPNELQRLAKALEGQTYRGSIHWKIFNDASDFQYQPKTKIPFRLYHEKINHGKRRYWQLVNKALRTLKARDDHYYFFIPDDAILEPDALRKAIEYIEKWNVPVVSLLNDRPGRMQVVNWGAKPMKLHDRYSNAFLDMLFICDRRYLYALRYRLHRIDSKRWKHNPKLGSGVGGQMTRRTRAAGIPIYAPLEVLIRFDYKAERKMNPHVRPDVKDFEE